MERGKERGREEERKEKGRGRRRKEKKKGGGKEEGGRRRRVTYHDWSKISEGERVTDPAVLEVVELD